MNRYVFLLAIFFCSTCKLFSQDTILLNDVIIEKSYKKPKLKKINVWKNNKGNHIPHTLLFRRDSVYYLTDSLPKGEIKNLTLYFTGTSSEINLEKYKTAKVLATDFEVTFYEVGDNYRVGKKINNEPFKISFEGGKGNSIVPDKVSLNLEQYNFNTQRFYTLITVTSKKDCENCYYYVPVLYKANDASRYVTKGKPIYKKTQNCAECFGLQMTVKILTQDY